MVFLSSFKQDISCCTQGIFSIHKRKILLPLVKLVVTQIGISIRDGFQ
jgi:hypothetical protein